MQHATNVNNPPTPPWNTFIIPRSTSSLWDHLCLHATTKVNNPPHPPPPFETHSSSTEEQFKKTWQQHPHERNIHMNGTSTRRELAHPPRTPPQNPSPHGACKTCSNIHMNETSTWTKHPHERNIHTNGISPPAPNPPSQNPSPHGACKTYASGANPPRWTNIYWLLMT